MNRQEITTALFALGQKGVNFAIKNDVHILEAPPDPGFLSLAHQIVILISELKTPSVLQIPVRVKKHGAVLFLGLGLPETIAVASLVDKYNHSLKQNLRGYDTASGEWVKFK